MTQQFTLPSFPLSSFLALAEACADYHGTALLYSGGSLDSAERSFLALFPFESATLNGHVLIHQKGGLKLHSEVQDPWKELQHHFFDHLEGAASSMAFGWLGYGMAAFADTDVRLPYRPDTVPDAYWQRCAIVIRYDHKLGQALVTVDAAAKEYVDEKSAHWIDSLTSREKGEHFFKQFSLSPRTPKAPPRPLPLSSDSQRRADYLDSVSAV